MEVLKNIKHSEILRAGYDALTYVANAGIKTTKEVILLYSPNKIQYRYTLEVGTPSTKIKGGLRRVQSKIMNPLIIDNVASVLVYSIPLMDNLTSEYVTSSGTKKIVDIPKILKNTDLGSILIQFENIVSKDEMNVLIPYPHMSQNPLYPSKNIISSAIEITTDYANLWYNQFDSIKIIEINREYTLIIAPHNLNELLSSKLKQKLNKMEQKNTLTVEDIKLLAKISNVFRKFETDSTLISQMSQAVSTDKPRNIEFTSFVGKTKEIYIHSSKLILPDCFKIRMKINLDAKDLTLSGNLTIDYKKIKPLIVSLSKEADELL